MKRVFVQSFGCRASQADGAAIEASLADNGYTAVRDSGSADLIVLNTCTVTHGADVDARRLIRGVHRDHPDSEILVTGCYAQRAPEEIASIEGVRWVVGNSHKTEIAAIVSATEYHGQVFVGDISAKQEFFAAPVRDIREDRTRPNLKIQDGCSNRCSFCIIPSVRGRSRSAPIESVIEQVKDLASRYREVVLSGINLGRWGRDLPGGFRFVNLLRKLLAETAVRRLRISSVEPMDWSQDLFELIANEPRIARHVHLPLQSGSDSVLKRMFRKYRTRHYASRIAIAHTLMPDAAIGADVMTGFPGETDAEFAQTCEFIDSLPFTYLHVFTYSERPGTAAASQKALVTPSSLEPSRECNESPWALGQAPAVAQTLLSAAPRFVSALCLRPTHADEDARNGERMTVSGASSTERYPMPTRSDFGGPVPIPIRQERTRILREISDKKNLEFRRRMLGKTLSAVTLEQRGMALTSNFLKVEMAAERPANEMVELSIAALSQAGLKESNPLLIL